MLWREDRGTTFAILYDTDIVIQKVRSQTRDFEAPSPREPKLRPVVKMILEELSRRKGTTAFVKMKISCGLPW